MIFDRFVAHRPSWRRFFVLAGIVLAVSAAGGFWPIHGVVGAQSPAGNDMQVRVTASPSSPLVGETVELNPVVSDAPAGAELSYRWDVGQNGEWWYSSNMGPAYRFLTDKPETWIFRVTVSHDSGAAVTSETVTVTWSEPQPEEPQEEEETESEVPEPVEEEEEPEETEPELVEPESEPEPIPPAEPTGLTVGTEAGSLEVSLDWDDIDDATDYWVRWRSLGGMLNSGVRVTSSEATINVRAFGRYVVQVQACNDAGCSSALSESLRAEPASECVAAQLESVSALGIENGLVLSWQAPASIPDSCELTGYTIDVSGDGWALSLIVGPGELSYTLTYVPAGEYTVSVWANYRQGSSRPKTLLSVQIPADCAITLEVTASGPYEVSGQWTNAAKESVRNQIDKSAGWGCEAGGVWVQFRQAGKQNWDTSHRLTNDAEDRRRFIFGQLDNGVEYEFRIVAIDARGIGVKNPDDSWKRTSNTASVQVSYNPGAVQNEHAPAISRVQADNHRGIIVSWQAPTGALTGNLAGYTLDSYTVSYKKTTGNAAETTSVSIDADVLSYVLQDISTSLDTYTVRVQAHYTHDTKADLTFNSPVSEPVTLFYEPTKIWFTDDTPNYNPTIGRIFMIVDTNKGSTSAICDINSGQINCPPTTLVSLDVYFGHSYTIHGRITSPGFAGKTDYWSVPPLRGPNPPFKTWVSGGDHKLYVAWRKAAPTKTSEPVNGYIVQYRKQNADNSWGDWVDGATVDENTLSHTFSEITTTETENGVEKEVTSPFPNGTYQVRVVGTADVVENGVTYTKRKGLMGARLQVALQASNSELPGIPERVKVFSGSGSLRVEWDWQDPAEGAKIYGYRIRYRQAGSTDWKFWTRKVATTTPTPSMVLTDPLEQTSAGVSYYTDDIYYVGSEHDYRLYCGRTANPSPHHCWNPRQATISGLTSGTQYEIQVQAVNANGNGPWASGYDRGIHEPD